MSPHQVDETLLQFRTGDGSIFDQAFVLDYIEDGRRSRAAHRITTECVEVARAQCECGENFWPQDRRRDRHAVAHRLAKYDDIWLDIVPREAPVAVAHPAEAGLLLVGDIHPALLSNDVEHRLQE